MKYYPVFLDVNERKCLVVGGGNVGTRKAGTLLKCGARVTVISPDMSEDLARMSENNSLTLRTSPYDPGDLDGVFLVFCATDNKELNGRIADDAKRRGILCNIADTPDDSDFILPSLVERGDLTLAVSTSGASPAFARKLRKDLSEQYGEEYGEFLSIMGRIRKKLLVESHVPRGHKALFEQLIERDLPGMLKNGDRDGVNRLITSVCGPGFEER